MDFPAELNRLVGSTNLDAQGAANILAGTVNMDLVGALNVYAGNTNVELNGVCQLIAATHSGTTGVDANNALIGITATPTTRMYGFGASISAGSVAITVVP